MSQDHATHTDKTPAPQTSQSSPTEDFSDEIDVIAGRFGTLYNDYEIQVRALQAAIDAKDPVGWVPTLAEALLDFALGKATEKIAAFLAARAVDTFKRVSHDSEPSPLGPLRTRNAKAIATIALPEPKESFDPTPLVTGMFSKGLSVGSAAGKASLRTASASPPLDRFVAANLVAANFATTHDRDHFLKSGRHQIKTKKEALALENAFSDAAITAAGIKHFEETRDAWISYVAQQQFGGRADGRTDMRNQERRDFSEKPIKEDGPDAPEPLDGMQGKNNGVLEVWAELPPTNGMWMTGEPRVNVAVLAGVNDRIRGLYKGKKLAECRVPRQITATVSGDHPDFVLNLDEDGPVNHLKHREASWLRDRSTVNHPENLAKDDGQKRDAGLKLLLEDLVLGELVSRAW
jgi:hypothetical protein